MGIWGRVDHSASAEKHTPYVPETRGLAVALPRSVSLSWSNATTATECTLMDWNSEDKEL